MTVGVIRSTGEALELRRMPLYPGALMPDGISLAVPTVDDPGRRGHARTYIDLLTNGFITRLSIWLPMASFPWTREGARRIGRDPIHWALGKPWALELAAMALDWRPLFNARAQPTTQWWLNDWSGAYYQEDVRRPTVRIAPPNIDVASFVSWSNDGFLAVAE